MAHQANNQQEKNKNDTKILITDNPVAVIPLLLNKLTKSQRKIFDLIYSMGRNKPKNGLFFSIKWITKITGCSERTVQYFISEYDGSLIEITRRNHKTHLWNIPEIVSNFINSAGGVKILKNWKAYKSKVMNMVCNDPDSQGFTKHCEQHLKKKAQKIASPPQQNLHPNLKFDIINTFEEKVLYKEPSENEILLRFGLKNEQIIRIEDDFGKKAINNAIDDMLWYRKIGKKIYYPESFFRSRALDHMMRGLKL